MFVLTIESKSYALHSIWKACSPMANAIGPPLVRVSLRLENDLLLVLCQTKSLALGLDFLPLAVQWVWNHKVVWIILVLMLLRDWPNIRCECCSLLFIFPFFKLSFDKTLFWNPEIANTSYVPVKFQVGIIHVPTYFNFIALWLILSVLLKLLTLLAIDNSCC